MMNMVSNSQYISPNTTVLCAKPLAVLPRRGAYVELKRERLPGPAADAHHRVVVAQVEIESNT